MKLLQESTSKSHNGFVKVFSHQSNLLNCTMKLSIFFPNKKVEKQIYFLSGLTCTHENFIQKGAALKTASELGLLLICPDTSPRGLKIDGEDESWDFGTGAGFYVDSTVEKWKNYKMYSYITKELPDLIKQTFPDLPENKGIMGHSMGGHGALSICLKNPGMFLSASAFSPISNPINCAWGQKAFRGYLGNDEIEWEDWDSSLLLKKYTGPKIKILVDQGMEDGFLKDGQLLVESLDGNNSFVDLKIRMQEGYDHSYWFIQTFIDDHLEFHHKNN